MKAVRLHAYETRPLVENVAEPEATHPFDVVVRVGEHLQSGDAVILHLAHGVRSVHLRLRDRLVGVTSAVDVLTGEFRLVQLPEAEMRSCRSLLVAALTAVSVVLPGSAWSEPRRHRRRPRPCRWTACSPPQG